MGCCWHSLLVTNRFSLVLLLALQTRLTIGLLLLIQCSPGAQVIKNVISARRLGGRSKKQYLMGRVLVGFQVTPCFARSVQLIPTLAPSIGSLTLWSLLHLFSFIPLVSHLYFFSFLLPYTANRSPSIPTLLT